MRKHKVLSKIEQRFRFYWQSHWLYEKLVEAEIPDEVIVRQAAVQGDIQQMARLMIKQIIDDLTGTTTVIKEKMRISAAEYLELDYDWHGEWIPVRRLRWEVTPRRLGR